MVTIAEEKRRKIGSNIGCYLCLIWLGYNCLFRDKEVDISGNILLATISSLSAVSAMYSKLRIEMLTLLGKTGKAE
jgi:hypothetical protein